MKEYAVNLIWDAEACVWIAISDDVPGLALESGSHDTLVERVRHAAPELLELNGLEYKDITLRFNSKHSFPY